MDRELTWREHCSNKIASAKKMLLLTLAITRANHGPSPKLMKWTYEGIVRPAISYAAVNWTYEINSAKILKGFKKLDRLAMLSFARVKPSTPTEGL